MYYMYVDSIPKSPRLWMSFSAFVNSKFKAIFIVISIVAHHMTARLAASKVFLKFKLRINDEYITI